MYFYFCRLVTELQALDMCLQIATGLAHLHLEIIGTQVRFSTFFDLAQCPDPFVSLRIRIRAYPLVYGYYTDPDPSLFISGFQATKKNSFFAFCLP
jgi:hypothetical protein